MKNAGYIANSKFRKSPCYGCTERTAGCRCKQYEDWRKEKWDLQQKIMEQDRVRMTLRANYYVAKEKARKRGL